MDGETAKLIATVVKMQCPFCSEEFMYKVNLRWHLKRKHDDSDAEFFIHKGL